MTELSQNLAQERSPKTWTRIGVQNSRARTCSKKSAEFSVENRFGKHSDSPAQRPSFFFEVQRPAATSDHPHAVANFSLNKPHSVSPTQRPDFFLYKVHCPSVRVGSPPPPPSRAAATFFPKISPAQRRLFFKARRSGRLFFAKHSAQRPCEISPAQRPIFFSKEQCPAASGRVRSAPRSGRTPV